MQHTIKASVLKQRINYRLRKLGQTLRLAIPHPTNPALSTYYIAQLADNKVVQTHVFLSAYAEEEGILRPGESIDYTS